MALSLITLNTGGFSNATKNASFKSYFDLLPFNYDVILLQETYNLSDLKTVPFGKIGPTMFLSPLQVFPLVPALPLLLKITLT